MKRAQTPPTADARQAENERLARIAGAVTGFRRMVEANRSCAKALQKTVALRSAIDQLGVEYVTGHLESCVLRAGQGGNGPAREPPAFGQAAEIRDT